MKLIYNVCKEITSLDPNEKTIASLQPNVSPGRYKLKLQANETNYEFVFVFAVSLKCSLIVFTGYFHKFTEFDGHFRYLNLAKIRDTVPLIYFPHNITCILFLSFLEIVAGSSKSANLASPTANENASAKKTLFKINFTRIRLR